jgi:hypothetical protein
MLKMVASATIVLVLFASILAANGVEVQKRVNDIEVT